LGCLLIAGFGQLSKLTLGLADSELQLVDRLLNFGQDQLRHTCARFWMLLAVAIVEVEVEEQIAAIWQKNGRATLSELLEL
jgi:hypothetical protein